MISYQQYAEKVGQAEALARKTGQLEAENARLRTALEPFVDPGTWAVTHSDYDTGCDHCNYKARGYDGEHDEECPVRIARAALTRGDEK